MISAKRTTKFCLWRISVYLTQKNRDYGGVVVVTPTRVVVKRFGGASDNASDRATGVKQVPDATYVPITALSWITRQ